MSANGQLRAKASPSKAFFIEMLTRDITLSDCVLDLVDNAIHRLIVETGLDVSEHLFAGSFEGDGLDFKDRRPFSLVLIRSRMQSRVPSRPSIKTRRYLLVFGQELGG